MSRDEKIIALREVLNELERNDWTPDPIVETAVDEHLLLYYGLDKIALPEGVKQLIMRAIVVIEDHKLTINEKKSVIDGPGYNPNYWNGFGAD